jgi:peptide deformylase
MKMNEVVAEKINIGPNQYKSAIVSYPNDVLRQTVPRITTFEGEKVTNLYDNVIKKMCNELDNTQASGLAAQQIGVPLAIVTVNKQFITGANNHRYFINPVVTGFIGKKISVSEGCLSLPGLRAKVRRFEAIDVTWKTLDGEEMKEVFQGLPAIILQHEINHINGILMIDHLTKGKRKQLMRQWSKQQKEKANLLRGL